MQYSYYDSPLGRLLLAGEFGILQQIKFNFQPANIAGEYNPAIFKDTTTQLDEYFLKQRKIFTIKYSLIAPPFFKKVLQQVAQVPFGRTTTYSEIAQQIGSPNAARAVGSANHKNPLPIIIPCHRVIGKNGKLVGFAAGIGNKERLLVLEQATY